MAASQKHLLPQARAFYAQGRSVPEIAACLPVSEKTIYRWKRDDPEDWGAEREETQRRSPQATINKLEEQFQGEVFNRDPEDSAYADNIYKLNRIIQDRRDEYGDYNRSLDVLHDLAKYALENHTDDERAVVSVVIDGFTEHLKRSAT